jgi:hypothetical protein
VTIWFDDAWKSQYQVGFKHLHQQQIVAALAVPTQLVNYPAYMNWNQIQRVQYHGWEISSHTRTHRCDWQQASEATTHQELVLAKTDLLAYGLRADHFVPPCGVYQPIEHLIKQHYRSSRTSVQGINPIPVPDPYQIHAHALHITTTVNQVETWLQQARDQTGWLILMFHQIDDSGDPYSVNPDTFYQMVAAVKQSGLAVVLPSQVLSVGNSVSILNITHL